MCACGFGTALLLALFIFQVTEIAEAVWRMDQGNRQLARLSEETRLAETREIKALSYREMEQIAEAGGFERVSHVSFLNAADTAVARRTK